MYKPILYEMAIIPNAKETAAIERIYKMIASNAMVAVLIFFGWQIVRFSNMVESMCDKVVKIENDRLTFEKEEAIEKLNQSKLELKYKYKILEDDSTK